MTGRGPGAKGGAGVLAVLLLTYIFNFIDRQIVGILAVPIKADLALSDTQLSLMGGFAFALFYSTIAIPIAWLADRRSRVNIIAGAVAIWSLFTAACGFAQNFWQLFLGRMGVGVGEAGGVAPSYALISDLYPKEQRARALAIFSLGIPIGSALGVFFGGWVASSFDWRAAFIAVGLAGLPVALLVKLVVKEPRRGEMDAGPVGVAAPPFLEVVATLARKRSFWLLAFGAASASLLGYGLGFWIPSYLNRSLGLGLADMSWYFGSNVLLFGMAGIWLGGWLGDRIGSRNPGGYALVPAISFLVTGPLYAAALFADSLLLAWLLLGLPFMLSLTWLGPLVTAVQQIVPASMRATASACFLLINNLIGIGLGIFLLGSLSDLLAPAHGEDSLRYAILYSLGFYLVATLLLVLASRSLRRDWYTDATRA